MIKIFKRALTIFLIAVLMAPMLLFSGCFPKEEVLLRFGVISDIHIPHGNGAFRIKTVIKEFLDRDVDLILFAGDIVDQAFEMNYDSFNNILNSALKDREKIPKMMFVMGNHDFNRYYNETFSAEEAIDMFKNKLGTELNATLEVNGFHFFALNSDDQNEEGTFSKSGQEFLKFMEGKDADKPVFVFGHQPPYDTVAKSTEEKAGNSYLNELFAPFPNVVYFAGHTHASLMLPDSIYQENFTVVNTGAVAYVSLRGWVDRNEIAAPSASALEAQESSGLYVEVTKKEILIHRLFFSNPVKMDGEDVWKIAYPIKKQDFKYTRGWANTGKAPMFNDSEITVSIVNNVCSFTFSAASCQSFVYCYRVTVYDGDSKEVLSDSYHLSDYYKGTNRMEKTVKIKVNLESSGKNLRSEIRALDYYGNMSEPIIKNFIS